MSAASSPRLPRRGPRLALQALLVAGVVGLAVGLLPAGAVLAAAPAIDQCNGSDNVGGQEVRCEVTITNSLDLTSGVGSSTVTVQECHGAAGAPTCSASTTTSFADVTTTVNQCNGSGGGGGGVVACNVTITNNLTGDATTAPATVNQCNGSGGGGGTEPTVQCSPIGSTTGATVTQCNDSGNGGGGTLRVQCTVDPSTQTAALPVTINQCNGSGNGGGATVTCRSSVTTEVQPAQAAPAPSESATPTTSPTPTSSATATASPTPTASPTDTATATPEPLSPAPDTSTTEEPAAEPDVQAPAPTTTEAAPVAGSSGDSVAGTDAPAAGPAEPVVGAAATTSTQVLGGATQLPRTGAKEELLGLTLSGLLLFGAGAALMLVAGRAPARAGRHGRLAA